MKRMIFSIFRGWLFLRRSVRMTHGVPRPSHCSPRNYKAIAQTGTCLTEDDVRTAAERILSTDTDTGTARMRSIPELLAALHERLGTRPNASEEVRWLASRDVASNPDLRSRIQQAFRPTHPESWLRNPKAWLSNEDIEAVMRQYEDHVPGFRFVGVFPRDFATRIGSKDAPCVSDEMCRLTAEGLLREGAAQVGIVFNLDKHTQSGSHWTSMYACLDPRSAGKPEHRHGVFYYDSTGRPPPKEMRDFAHRLRGEIEQLQSQGGKGSSDKKDTKNTTRIRVTHNRIRKQFQDTECGIYSILSLVAMIHTDVRFEEMCKEVMKRDGKMQEMRKILFRPPS